MTADPSVNPNVQIFGGGTLNLTSTTNNASTPDIYFNFNDLNNNANWGTSIAANINLGSDQRYFFGKDNHDSFGNYGQSADVYISGNISGSGGISFIAQNSYGNIEVSQTDFVLAGDDSFSGEVEIQRGAVYLDNPDALTQNNVLVLDPAAGFNAWFYLYGNSTTVSDLQSSGAGTSIIANSPGNSVGAATLTILESGDIVYAGTFADVQSDYANNEGGGPLSIAVTTTNTFTLTGANGYTGSTTVSGGVLSVGADANLGNAGTIILDGGTLLATSSFTLNSSRSIILGDPSTPATGGEIDIVAGATLTFAGAVEDNTGGGDNLTVGSSGNTGTLILDGNSTFTGTLTLSAGTLAGTGSVGAVADSAVIAPGAAPGAAGILNTGSLSFGAGGSLTLDLNGTGSAGVNYDQLNINGGIDLTNAALNLNVNYGPLIGDSFTIIHNVTGGPITGHFNGLLDGADFVVSGHLFQISYEGNGNNDVVVTAAPAPVYYVEADGWSGEHNGGSWTGLIGQTIPDADPVASGNQSAVFGGNSPSVGSGYQAFTTVTAALTQAADDNAAGAIIVVNGGTYNENVVVNQAVTLDLQYADSIFNSLAGNNIDSNLDLNGVTLTTGGAASTAFAGSISGPGNLTKIGAGMMTLSGNDTYAGTTEVSAGILQLGSATALSANTAVLVNASGNLQLNGNSVTVASLAGSGMIEDASATAATLTLSSAGTFDGALLNGTGGGALGLTVNGPGTYSLTGASNTYTGVTTINNGELSVASLAPGDLAINNGTFDYYTVGSTVSSNGNLTIGAGGATIDVDDMGSTVTFNGTVNGGNNGLTLNGAAHSSSPPPTPCPRPETSPSTTVRSASTRLPSATPTPSPSRTAPTSTRSEPSS